MNTNIISVIIPSYRPLNYLYECLNSLENQTLSSEKFEILLILNGCCEPYKSQIENYLLEHNIANLRLIQIDQAGVSNARNIGLEKACGDYICFVDDDDIVSSKYLEALLAGAEQGAIVVSNVRTFYSSLSDLGMDYLSYAYSNYSNSPKNIFANRHFLSSACCKIIPKCIIADRKFDSNIRVGEDSLFMFLISDKISRVILADSSAIYYRRLRKGSALRAKKDLSTRFLITYYLVIRFSLAYFSKPFSYNLLLYISRVLASFKNLLR